MPGLAIHIHNHFDNQFIVQRHNGHVVRLSTAWKVTAIVLSVLLGIPSFGILALPMFYLSTGIFRQVPRCWNNWNYPQPVVVMPHVVHPHRPHVVPIPVHQPHLPPVRNHVNPREQRELAPVRPHAAHHRPVPLQRVPVEHGRPVEHRSGVPARRMVR